MIARRTVYFFQKACANLSLHPLAATATLINLVLCQVLLGISFVLLWSLHLALPSWIADTKVVAYFPTQTPSYVPDKVMLELEQWREVEGVRKISAEEAWRQLQRTLEGWQDVLEGIPDNPLPASLEITVRAGERPSETMDAFLGKLRQYSEIEEIYSGKAWAEKIDDFTRPLTYAGIGLAALIVPAMILLIANAGKLTLLARRDELEIYGIVGAKPYFLQTPSYFEGIFQGGVSSAIASGLLVLLILSLRDILPAPAAAAFSWKTPDISILVLWIFGWGLAIGAAGPWIALKQYFRIP